MWVCVCVCACPELYICGLLFLFFVVFLLFFWGGHFISRKILICCYSPWNVLNCCLYWHISMFCLSYQNEMIICNPWIFVCVCFLLCVCSCTIHMCVSGLGWGWRKGHFFTRGIWFAGMCHATSWNVIYVYIYICICMCVCVCSCNHTCMCVFWRGA